MSNNSTEGWHGFNFEEKQAFVKTNLDIAFSQACELKDTPRNIFWNIMLLNIHRENERTWGAFLNLNPWIVTDPSFVYETENRTGLKFEEIPNGDKCPKFLKKFFESKYLIYVVGAIVLIIAVVLITRKRKAV